MIERLPEAADDVARRLEELRVRRCFVDGDFAMKNMLVGRDRNWVLDFEVAHYGNPIFDLGFFLSFVVLSAVRWPALEQDLRSLADGFGAGYAEAAGEHFAGDDVDVTAHTGCLVLARTDGKSPAQFLDGRVACGRPRCRPRAASQPGARAVAMGVAGCCETPAACTPGCTAPTGRR